jgi:glutamyl-tRNA reductase
MSVLVLGMNHRSADFALLGRVAVPADEHAKVLRALTSLDHVLEAVVLSTCNRVEVYAHVSRFHAGLDELLAWFAARGDVDRQLLDAVHYAYHDDRAAAHLFAVAAGVDSMVVGERQIALQVKQAANLARDEGASRRVLQRLFDQALHVSRRVRAETDIGRGASSIVDVGLDVASGAWSGGDGPGDGPALAGRTVVVVGAGTMGSLTADRLLADGAGRVLVRNRSRDRADRLAARVGGETVGEGRLAEAVAAADLVVCCTGASMPVLDAEVVAAAVRGRDPQRPLVLLDLAMPPNVDPDCHQVPGVSVVDLGAVRAVTDGSVTGDAIEAARDIVQEEADAFHAWTRAVRVDPTIRSLRQRAEAVRTGELERLSAKLSSLGGREREAVEALTRGIVNTLLHDPTVRLKALADHGGAEHYAVALRELFDLDE